MLYQSGIDHQAVCVHNSDDDVNWDNLDDAFEKLLKDIYKGKKKVIDENTTIARAEILTNAMIEGYGNDFVTVDYDSPDLEMLKHLRANVWVFSGFADNQMIKDLSAALIDENGKVRSENEFFKAAEKIGKVYNRDRLRVERNHAIATSQMAARWTDYQANKDIAPNLRYVTAGDDRVRQAHRALNNIVRPIDDSFWATYYPPNDWGCRCDVQAEDGQVTDLTDKNLPVLKSLFNTNLASSGVLYPEGHPYFQVSEEDAKEVKKELDKISNKAVEFKPSGIDRYAETLGITVNDEIFSYLNSPVRFRTGTKGGAHFDPKNKSVFIPVDQRRKNSKWYAEAVVYHEYGHAADQANKMRRNPKVKGLMEKYRQEFGKEANKRFQEIHQRIYSKLVESQKNQDYDSFEKSGAAFDTLCSLNSSFGGGHSKYYFSLSGMPEAEFLAHMFENRFKGNEIFKEVMPELYEEMIKLADELHPLKQE